MALAQSRPTRAFVLVVAHNRSVDRSVSPLRYADDDGARIYEVMSSFSERAVLLSILDDETQKIFPELARVARPPTRVQLRRAMNELRGEMVAARKAGFRTAFYFYFAGHGDVGADREGYINLLRNRFSRSDLYTEVIARSPADVNHIIIDACNSYYLVNRRGGRRARASHHQAIRSFLAEESLERYPQTGVLLSTASMNETHEWSLYRSGIFSYQLLSALLGGADVNGDGQIAYGELAAYIAAANLQVRDSRARLSIYAHPPKLQSDAPLLDMHALRRVAARDRRPMPARVGAFLHVPKEMQGHYYLEDDRGVRYMDFNKSAEQPLRLALLDRPYYYLRSAQREALVRLGDESQIRAASLPFSPLETQSRGSVEQSFRKHLFATPFGRSFVMGYEAAEGAGRRVDAAVVGPTDEERPWYSRLGVWKWTTAAVAVAAVGLAVPMQVLSMKSADKLQQGAGKITMAEAVDLQDQSNLRQTVAAVSFGVAGAAAASSLVLFLLDRSPGEAPQSGRKSGFALLPGAASASLLFSGSF